MVRSANNSRNSLLNIYAQYQMQVQARYTLTITINHSLQNPQKITKHTSVQISENSFQFFLPGHKADRFFEGNSIVLLKTNSSHIPVFEKFHNYLTSCDKLFPYHSPLWWQMGLSPQDPQTPPFFRHQHIWPLFTRCWCHLACINFHHTSHRWMVLWQLSNIYTKKPHPHPCTYANALVTNNLISLISFFC